MSYQDFLERKRHLSGMFGFNPTFMPDKLFDFQKSLVDWSVRKGRAAIFADCGLGKTFIQLTWAENIVRKTGGRVLILTPLSVGFQTVIEAQKLGIDAARCSDGNLPPEKIVVANYERLHYFNPNDFCGVVCDESSILKNFEGATKNAISNFMLKMPYRLLCTATASPNDYIELGTSSEALGDLGYIDMLKMFFKAENNTYATGGGSHGGRFDRDPFAGKFRFRGHSQKDFWRWVCSWARAVRKPSDIGFSDKDFVLPELIVNQHTVTPTITKPGFLFNLPAIGLSEEREERRRSLPDRVEFCANIVNSSSDAFVCWCNLNDEGDMLEELIPGSVQVSGSDSDDHKEGAFADFASGNVRVLITKPTIAGFGLNWQHCHRQTFFPTHSFEQWYQAIRRCWRFGQKNPVTVDVVNSEGEISVLANLQRKAKAADDMFSQLVQLMGNELKIEKVNKHINQEHVPSWL